VVTACWLALLPRRWRTPSCGCSRTKRPLKGCLTWPCHPQPTSHTPRSRRRGVACSKRWAHRGPVPDAMRPSALPKRCDELSKHFDFQQPTPPSGSVAFVWRTPDRESRWRGGSDNMTGDHDYYAGDSGKSYQLSVHGDVIRSPRVFRAKATLAAHRYFRELPLSARILEYGV